MTENRSRKVNTSLAAVFTNKTVSGIKRTSRYHRKGYLGFFFIIWILKRRKE